MDLIDDWIVLTAVMVTDELQKATRYTNLGVCGRPARGSCLIFTTVAVLKNTLDGSLYKSRCVCVREVLTWYPQRWSLPTAWLAVHSWWVVYMRLSYLVSTAVVVVNDTSSHVPDSLCKSRCVVYTRFLPGIRGSGSDEKHIWWFAVQIQVHDVHEVLTWHSR